MGNTDLTINQSRTVHFTPCIEREITKTMENPIDTVSLSISQLDLGDGAEERMTEDSTPTTSLRETLMEIPTPPQENSSTGATPSNAPELPFLAEATWKLARNATRAGIKVRTYARHLDDLSQDDTNPIITPWAIGTAPVPSYIVEDRDLMTKIGNAR